MFDFNGDGRTDSGEQFVGYQIFTDTTKSMNSKPKTGARFDGFDMVIISLLAWQVISLLFGGGH